jgi:hypothetical protein
LTAALPATVGLKIHPRLRVIELRRATLIGLIGLLLGGGAAVFSVWLVWGVVDVAQRYDHGVRAQQVRLLKMSISRGVLTQVSARVSYADASGSEHAYPLSVDRFLDSPEPGDPIEVRYAEHEQSSAVSSWERESAPHELAFAFAGALMSAGFLFGALREARLARGRLALATEIEHGSGELAVVQLLETKRDELGFRVVLRYRYRTPSGAVLRNSIALSEGGAYRVNESAQESLALLSRDGQRGLLLTRSGYPLQNVSEALENLRGYARKQQA